MQGRRIHRLSAEQHAPEGFEGRVPKAELALERIHLASLPPELLCVDVVTITSIVNRGVEWRTLHERPLVIPFQPCDAVRIFLLASQDLIWKLPPRVLVSIVAYYHMFVQELFRTIHKLKSFFQ